MLQVRDQSMWEHVTVQLAVIKNFIANTQNYFSRYHYWLLVCIISHFYPSWMFWNWYIKGFFYPPSEVNLQGPVCHIKTEGKTTIDWWCNEIYFRGLCFRLISCKTENFVISNLCNFNFFLIWAWPPLFTMNMTKQPNGSWRIILKDGQVEYL